MYVVAMVTGRNIFDQVEQIKNDSALLFQNGRRLQISGVQFSQGYKTAIVAKITG